MTGSEPGRPRHTGHVAEFGGRPNLFRHPQNNFVFVSNWTWTSSPITILYGSAIASLRNTSANGITGIVAGWENEVRKRYAASGVALTLHALAEARIRRA